MSTWSIFGCGPGGLYSAWRLVTSGRIQKGDTLVLYDWGKYAFESQDSGTRSPAGRVCTYYYQNNPLNSYIEVGGMRYKYWDGKSDTGGHRLVTTVIDQLGLADYVEPFNTTEDPLFYLRQKNFYSSEISSSNPAPYNADHSLADYPPAAGKINTYQYVVARALGTKAPSTRSQECEFYATGTLPDKFVSATFKGGDPITNIGYWNLMFDQLGSEGYQYAAAGGGYQSNVINWNTADALISNSEFAPGAPFKTLRNGYSAIFRELFRHIQTACIGNGIPVLYFPNTRLRSIWLDAEHDNAITFTLATAEAPYAIADKQATTQYAFLAMPPGSLEIVAEATRYDDRNIVDVLNADKVALYREAVIKQPSYKVAMFFATDWWVQAMYPPKLDGAPANKGKTNVFGPTITDTPLRQIYYFGNNGLDEKTSVYAMLCSYDDERFVRFWQELELTVEESRTLPLSQDTQPLKGAKRATPAMVNMLRDQLARVHFGPGADASIVPEPLETVFMDWSLKPFSAGYHAWSAHYDINDVMQTIRKPTQLIEGAEANLFIVGSAYSNDQAWVEGAFCTSESVLTDFLNLKPIISEADYPFICRCAG